MLEERIAALPAPQRVFGDRPVMSLVRPAVAVCLVVIPPELQILAQLKAVQEGNAWGHLGGIEDVVTAAAFGNFRPLLERREHLLAVHNGLNTTLTQPLGSWPEGHYRATDGLLWDYTLRVLTLLPYVLHRRLLGDLYGLDNYSDRVTAENQILNMLLRPVGSLLNMKGEALDDRFEAHEVMMRKMLDRSYPLPAALLVGSEQIIPKVKVPAGMELAEFLILLGTVLPDSVCAALGISTENSAYNEALQKFQTIWKRMPPEDRYSERLLKAAGHSGG